MPLKNNGGNSWYTCPSAVYASSVVFRDDDFPDVNNVSTALTFLQNELKNLVLGGGGAIDDTTVGTLTTWSSNKILNEFVQQVPGMGLSENNFSNQYKQQLDLMVNYVADMAYLRGLAHDHANKPVLDGITLAKIAYWDNKSNFSGDYNDLINKPDLTNLTKYATKEWVQLYHENNSYAKLSLYPDYAELVRKDQLDLLNTNLTYAKKQWVLDQIASRNDFKLVRVTVLPTEATEGAGNIDTNKIYLLQTNVNPDLYEKWINLDGTDQGWELLSSTLMDLTNYYDKQQIDQFRANDTKAENISVADVANLFVASNVENALKELKQDINKIDPTLFAKIADLADIAFSGEYNDIVDKPIELLVGETVAPIVWSEVPAGIYFARGAQRVLTQSNETPDVICYGTTELYHYNDGNGNRVSTAFTSKLVAGQFKPCTVIMTYPDSLVGTPTVEYYYYPNTNEVLTKDNITPYEPTADYHPATKLYVDEKTRDIDLTNYLAKDNTTVYEPTADYHPATKKYVDDTKPKLVSELTNDLDYLKRSELVLENDAYQYIKRSVVTTLPAPVDAKMNIVYMIQNATGEYDKYIYTGSNNGNNGFEQFGGGVDEVDVKKHLFELQADGVTPDETLPLYVPVDEMMIHTKPEVLTWIGSTQQQIDSYLDLIDDTQMDLLKTWSSVKINGELLNTLNDGKAYTDYIASIINRPQYEHVNSLDEMIQTDRFYLLETAPGSGKFDMYIVNANDGTKTCVGNTEVDLREYQKIEEPTLTTANKTIPGGINELDRDIGKLNDLTTVEKGSVVEAINEHDTEIGNLANLTTNTRTNLVSAINEHDNEIGNLNALTTTEKSDLVLAINEIYGKLMPVGTVIAYAGSTAPNDYMICDGASLLKADYPELYAVIGDTYGSTTDEFNLPNLKGRVPVGLSGLEADFSALGKTGGHKSITLTTDQIPSHTHTFTGTAHTHTFTGTAHSHGASSNSTGSHQHGMIYPDNTNGNPDGATDSSSENTTRRRYWRYPSSSYTNSAGSHSHTIYVNNATAGGTNSNTTAGGTNSNTGGDGGHSNLQPYITLNFVIKVK